MQTEESSKNVVEIIDHLDEHPARGIALTTTAGLDKGDKVTGYGKPIGMPTGEQLLGRMFSVFG